MEAIGINFDALQSGLKAVRALRSSVIELFKLLGDGASAAYGDEEREKFLNEVQVILGNTKVRMREMETAGTLLGTPNPPLNLGNSGLLSQDPAYEKTPLYSELVKSHRWFDKLVDLSLQASTMFSQNALKRAPFSPLAPSKQLRAKPTGHNLPPQYVDQTTSHLHRSFPEIELQVMKPYGSSTVITMSIARTVKAMILLRGLIIDFVVVKGYNEDFYGENDKLDIWSESRYLVFQKVTEHANAAMLHFYSPNLPDLAIRSFLTWLRSYGSLFTAPCRKCGNRLLNNMPPTWRDVRNLDVYHESCKP
ncbi:mediator of RNA polymerase II transcription subunit 27-B [Caerostris extrusa]|uniref:Mediator of RNA polymerase II transcription subunit 27-B n=1 Tax=Caerostris extrusa TaxID=172846 RepID=A0AAV4MDZ7_CAEEX|nr:mediator of RNA polymerase II transcription subunit 27-B [Caerostris extrusa]